MKRIVLILAIALVLIGVIAAPAMADKPLLTFETALADDLGGVSGTLADGFTLVTARTPGLFHQLTLTDTTVDPGLKDGMYAFYLQAQGPQKAALKDYFALKGWPSEFLAQIKTEITGGSPFFYLKADGGEYTLVDGFMWELFGVEQTLKIDDDYPIGTYEYKGHLKATNNALLQVVITLEVK